MIVNVKSCFSFEIKELWGFLRLDFTPEVKKQMGTIYSEVPARLTPSYAIWRNIITHSTGGKQRNFCCVCTREFVCICSSACLTLCYWPKPVIPTSVVLCTFRWSQAEIHISCLWSISAWQDSVSLSAVQALKFLLLVKHLSEFPHATVAHLLYSAAFCFVMIFKENIED